MPAQLAQFSNETLVKTDLEFCWFHFNKRLGSALCYSKKEKESQRFFIIGVERIKRGHKVALQATFTLSLLKVIFGIDAGLDSTVDVLVKQSRCFYIFHV